MKRAQDPYVIACIFPTYYENMSRMPTTRGGLSACRWLGASVFRGLRGRKEMHVLWVLEVNG